MAYTGIAELRAALAGCRARLASRTGNSLRYLGEGALVLVVDGWVDITFESREMIC